MLIQQNGFKCGVATVLILFFGSGVRASVVVDWALVGDPGNTADTAAHSSNPAGQGSVSYAYKISKTEVTNAQYVEFLNAKDPNGGSGLGLYNSSMTADQNGGINYASGAANGSKYSVKAGRGNKPVVFISWYDSARFANWVHNGQGNGDTESGSYTLLGGSAQPSNALTITRNANATVVLPSEDEWYKAAYYKGGSVNAGYWNYATKNDSVPISEVPAGGTNSANYYNTTTGYALTGSTSFSSSQDYLTDVGAYGGSGSEYGTFDQAGNAWEWDEALSSGSFRGIRGGSWGALDSDMASTHRRFYGSDSEDNASGFRLVSVPEPASLTLLAIGGMALLHRRRRS